MPGDYVQVHIPVSLPNDLLGSTMLSLLQSIWIDEEELDTDPSTFPAKFNFPSYEAITTKCLESYLLKGLNCDLQLLGSFVQQNFCPIALLACEKVLDK